MFPNFVHNVRTAFENGVNGVNGAMNPSPDTAGSSTGWSFPSVGVPFGMSTQQHHQHQQQQHPSQPRKAPPASIRAIRQLPTIRVAPADLVDPNNRECCICLEDNNLDDIVTRMPCAHIFHTHCILDWLRNHGNTCPVCRYELATDDPTYEAGRVERMKARKPRYAMHELKRMTIPDLLALHRRPNVTTTTTTTTTTAASINRCQNTNYGGLEKAELIQMLIDHGRIDVVPTPEPVEYKLETLQKMRIGELKRTMNDNGVYFRPEDVVEKSDMLVLFQNSGRLILTMESELYSDSFSEPTTTDESTLVFTASSSDPSTASSSLRMNTNSSSVSSRHQNGTTCCTTDPFPAVETVEDSDDETQKEFHDDRLKQRSSKRTVSSSEVLFAQQDDDFSSTTNAAVKNDVQEYAQANTTENDAIHSHVETSQSTLAKKKSTMGRNPLTTTSRLHEERMETTATLTNNLSHGQDDTYNAGTETQRINNSFGLAPMDIDDDNDNALSDFQFDDHGTSNIAADQTEDLNATFKHYTISQLQALAQDTNIDLSSCFERRDMVNLFVNAGIHGSTDPTAISPIIFSSWSVSQLRAVASQAKIDLSRCADKDQMVDQIIQESNSADRQHLRVYVRTLSPLTRSSLSELRAIARELRVDISDCLEKDEIIQRMIHRGPRRI